MNTRINLEWINDLPHNLTLREFAREIRRSDKTVRRWIQMGLLRSIKIRDGGSARVLIPRCELKRLIEEAMV